MARCALTISSLELGEKCSPLIMPRVVGGAAAGCTRFCTLSINIRGQPVRILIVDPHATGHHASYMRWLAQAAVRMQWGVVIATARAALVHPLLASISAEFEDVEIHLIEGCPNVDGSTMGTFQLMFREFAYWGMFRRIVKEVRAQASIDAVVLPYVDYCFHALAMLGSPFQKLPWCGISMRLGADPSAVQGRSGLPLKWRLAKRVLRSSTLRMLFVINPSVQNVPSKWLPPTLLSKLRYLADPAQYKRGVRQESRAALGISDTDVAILVFGSIDERKGIDSLLNCLASQERLENYVVILAGRQSEYFSNLLRVDAYARLLSKNRLIVLDCFLSEGQKDLVFTAADVVWVGYLNHLHMSGVLVLAGMARLPVVGTAKGEIGRLIERYGLGVVAEIDRPDEVGRALHTMLDARARSEMGRKGQSAFSGHTVENFGASVMREFNFLQGSKGAQC